MAALLDGVHLQVRDAATGHLRFAGSSGDTPFANVTYSVDGKTIAGIDYAGSIREWNIETGAAAPPSAPAGLGLYCLAARPHGWLVCNALESRVTVMDRRTATPLATIEFIGIDPGEWIDAATGQGVASGDSLRAWRVYKG